MSPRLTAASRLVLAGLLPIMAACQSAARATPTENVDDFAVVRQRAEAAYVAGRQALERGDLEAALVSLDQAKVNDPDNRADIQAALDETLGRLRALPPTPAPVPATPGPAPTPARPDPASVAPTAGAAGPPGLAVWTDPGQRFSVAAPPDWAVLAAPRAPFGTGAVGFRDPEGRSELVVAVDENAQAVSPELYAARMELAAGGTPGYALESVVPGTTAGVPSVRRTFVANQRDATGQSVAVRGFQVVLLRTGAAWVLAATAPVAQYARLAPVFEGVVSSFTFR